MDCYWFQIGTELGLLGVAFFATLWWLLRRRYLELRSVYHAHLNNMAVLRREGDNLEYERYLRMQKEQKR